MTPYGAPVWIGAGLRGNAVVLGDGSAVGEATAVVWARVDAAVGRVVGAFTRSTEHPEASTRGSAAATAVAALATRSTEHA